MANTMMFNPYTGTPRHPSDIASDPAGLLIIDDGEPLRAAAKAKPEAQQLGDEQRRAILAECGWINAQTQDAERNRQVLFSFRRTIDRIEQACAEAWGVKLGASGEAS